MADQWIVRVQDREYGPVGVEELREWKREGRLIRENEIREPGSERWIRAGELPEVFADELDEAPMPPPIVRRLSFGEILAAGWRIYVQGFARFFALALLVAVPACLLQLAAPFLEAAKPGSAAAPSVISAAVIAFVLLMLLVIAWPFSLAGMQLLAADLLAGGNPSLGEILNRAKPLWTRMFLLGLMVYGSYILWTIIPLLVALSLAAGEASLSSMVLVLCLLIFTAYMVARLFINFLFWQQAGALSGGDTMDALRESKALARSRTELPRMQRPLYRGALIASVWLLVLIFLNVAIELPVVLYRMRDVTSLEQATALLQSMSTASRPDVLSGLTTLLSTLLHALLRPWLAAIFVALYFDSKGTMSKAPNE